MNDLFENKQFGAERTRVPEPGTVEFFVGQMNVVKNQLLLNRSKLLTLDVLKESDIRAKVMEKAQRALLLSQATIVSSVSKRYEEKMLGSLQKRDVLGNIASWESELLFEEAQRSVEDSIEIDLSEFTRPDASVSLSIEDAKNIMNIFKKELKGITPAFIGFTTRAFAVSLQAHMRETTDIRQALIETKKEILAVVGI
jgi:hypothetical protein